MNDQELLTFIKGVVSEIMSVPSLRPEDASTALAVLWKQLKDWKPQPETSVKTSQAFAMLNNDFTTGLWGFYQQLQSGQDQFTEEQAFQLTRDFLCSSFTRKE